MMCRNIQAMIIAFTLIVLAAGIAFYSYSLSGTTPYRGWKMSGVWSNDKSSFQVLIHKNGSMLRGHLVKPNDDKVIEDGSLVISEVKLKPFWKWSTGVYIDPFTNRVSPLRLRLRSRRIISLRYIEEEAGNEIVKKEEWRLVDPLE